MSTRRIGWRRSAGGAVVAVVAAASAGAAGQQYEVVDLGLPPGASYALPLAINNAGEAVGYFQGSGFHLGAWVWRPGTGLEVLPPPAGFTDSAATDITDSGLIVGYAQNGLMDENRSRGWIYEDGVYELLPPFPDSCFGVVPEAMNESREVVGHTCTGGFPRRHFYYSAATGYIDLGDLFGANSAHDINESGVVTGGTFGSAYRWQAPAGAPVLLGTLEAPFDDGSEGWGINESEEVAGVSEYVQTGPDHTRAFFHSDATGMLSIAPTHLARSWAWALNDHGHVVGTEGNISSFRNSPWVWKPGEGRVFLNDVASDPAFTVFDNAIDINNDGEVVLMGHSAVDTTAHAVILRPIGPACGADFDGSGALDVDDFSAFRSAFLAGDPRADFDGSGRMEVGDFAAFRAAFLAGCE